MNSCKKETALFKKKKTIQGALIQLSFEEKLPSIQKKSGFHRKNKSFSLDFKVTSTKTNSEYHSNKRNDQLKKKGVLLKGKMASNKKAASYEEILFFTQRVNNCWSK